MNRRVMAVLGAVVLAVGDPLPAVAGLGVIDRACRQSERSQATPQLCSCIQKVANSSLNLRERRIVAKWFRDPSKAEEIRRSERRRDDALWERYQAFGERARDTCGAP